jgi:hypothetical protein
VQSAFSLTCCGLSVILAAPAVATAPTPEVPSEASGVEPSVPSFDVGERADWRKPPVPLRQVEEEPERGTGRLVAGIVLTSLGALGTIAGGIMAGVVQGLSDGRARGTGALVLPGLVVLGVGVPLTIGGAMRYRQWKAWRQRNPVEVAPVAGRSTHGSWMVGVSLRF